jgi:hypothetical protein
MGRSVCQGLPGLSLALRKGERRQSETGGGGIAVAREAGTVGRRS